MSSHSGTQRVRRLIFSVFALCGGLFGASFPVFAAVMPAHEAVTGIGTGPKAPTAIAHDRWGRLYVVETAAHRLDIYDAQGAQAGRIGGLNSPLSVAVDRHGLLYIGSRGNGSVTLYDKHTLKPLGKLGNGDGEFGKPTAIATDRQGRIYVADAKRGVVKIFSPNGSLLLSFGRDGTGPGEFRHPVALLVREYTEEILVLDFGDGMAGRVQIFDRNGHFKRHFKTMGAQAMPLVRPIGMAMDPQQRLYVSDAFSSQIAVYDPEGRYLGGLSTAGAPLHNPLGMTYEPALGRLYIASLNNARIVAFELSDPRRGRGGPRPARGKRGPAAGEERPSRASTAPAGRNPACPRPDGCRQPDSRTAPPLQYTLRAIAGSNGKVSPAGARQIAAGGSARFQITPDPGYRIAGVKVDGAPVNNLAEHTFTDIRADHLLEVAFAAILEVGTLQVDHDWRRITFKTPFTDPVVVARPATHNDPDPAVVRIRNLDQTGFDVRLQEWDYLDGIHRRETLSYLAMERGTHKLPGGAQIEAGEIGRATRAFGRTAFQQAFDTKPIVVASITTVNGEEAVTGRIRKVTPEGFDYRLQAQESHRRRLPDERAAYIAWTPSAGTLDGLSFEVAAAGNAIDHRFQPLAFRNGFAHPPALIAGMQTTRGGDTANLRIRHTGPLTAEIRVDEEQSRDTETLHAREEIGYLAFGASLAEVDADYDHDGLTDADEINLYGSSALASDTDGDGLADGDERRFWAAAWGLDPDGDGQINLLDPDADNDHHPDGAEHSAGSDPADPFSTPAGNAR